METNQFARRSPKHWSSGDLDEFTTYIAGHPQAWDVVADSGGVRKVRWMSQGRGKRGGARIIYFYHSSEMPLDFYAKGEKDNLDSHDNKQLRMMVQTILRKD